MADREPAVELAPRFSSPEASARPWDEARARLEQAQLYWVSTVRPDGRPHVTPLIAVWADDRLCFCTGADERKARNLGENPSCVVTTGCNTLSDGLDVVVEGQAVNLRDDARLQVIADAYVAKYGEEWRFTVAGGELHDEHGGAAIVFEVAPTTAFGFGKGEPFSQTRYRF
jgi:general stress protein 26